MSTEKQNGSEKNCIKKNLMHVLAQYRLMDNVRNYKKKKKVNLLILDKC